MGRQSSRRVAAVRAHLARADSFAELRRRVLAAAPRFHHDLRRSQMIGPRPELGLRVLTLDTAFRGMAAPDRRETVVMLRRNDRPEVRRYTLAHELAHALLIDVERDELGLTPAAEEILCEGFARAALMPPAYVVLYLRRHGTPSDFAGLRDFCRTFRVSYSAAVATLAEHVPPEAGTAIVAATRRGHPARTSEIAFRTDWSATDPRMFAPRDQRLRSVGLRELAAWADEAEIGDEAQGYDRFVVLRARGCRAATWCGPARWSAIAINAPRTDDEDEVTPERALLAFIDVSRLATRRDDPSRPRRARRGAVAALPDEQLVLAG